MNVVEEKVYPVLMRLFNDMVGETLDEHEEKLLTAVAMAVESYEKAKGWEIPHCQKKYEI